MLCTHLRVDRGALHLVESVSDFFQIGDVGPIWVEGPVPRRTLREGINKKFLNATWVDLEVKLVRDRVQPALKAEYADQR